MNSNIMRFARKLPMLFGSIILVELLGSIGTVFTAPEITSWYATLQKPIFTPPSWVFAPVWITLFALIGISLYLVLEKRQRHQRAFRLSAAVFSIQMFLNILWSALFFGLHSPALGLACIIFLLFSIVAMILAFHKISRASAFLLIPYLSWVTIATILNLYILLLNP